ncbi:DNA cytosine methyltransferase [Heliorestis convoluta]|uniref:Cytosine-specific methyltransferase n=1 Tax=Heliorestis convoluta TaxID=356322 RepID=A0A5Q2N230_9FIRM|nr:DNA cytosine methyltransferase [Heliorestis convoluta]QGG47676.1 DNA (cytosine-5-)-methyltransferase family protein [Heliorestis convoluta]
MKMGSLFDGIGGFPLAGQKVGIACLWASEIEPFPIKVTQKHFPRMIHLGDIVNIDGAKIEPVDLITFGSPCQDLSVAGKREGLKGERSSLFLEAIRIIKEMRKATKGEFPRYVLWENVPGAYSSNKGEDFRRVIEEISQSKIPLPASGKWARAGMVRVGECEIAWRTLDAQYWGVPQRRKRIFLIADFRGTSATKILFESEGMSRDSLQIREKREAVTTSVGKSSKKTNIILFEPRSQDRIPRIHEKEICPTLNKSQGEQRQTRVVQVIPINDKATRYKGGGYTRNSDGSGNGLGIGKEGDPFPTLTAGDRHAVAQFINYIRIQRSDSYEESTIASTIASRDYKSPTDLISLNLAVRRLTPLECERLQGFPDGWTDCGSDTARYKALGNSIAIPCVEWILEKMVKTARLPREKCA